MRNKIRIPCVDGKAKLDVVNVELALYHKLGDILVDTICQRKSEIRREYKRYFGEKRGRGMSYYLQPWWWWEAGWGLGTQAHCRMEKRTV